MRFLFTVTRLIIPLFCAFMLGVPPVQSAVDSREEAEALFGSGMIGAAAISTLLFDKDAPMTTKSSSLQAAPFFGKDIVSALQCLAVGANGDSAWRVSVIQASVRVVDHRLVPVLVDTALNGQSVGVRKEALRGLGQYIGNSMTYYSRMTKSRGLITSIALTVEMEDNVSSQGIALTREDRELIRQTTKSLMESAKEDPAIRREAWKAHLRIKRHEEAEQKAQKELSYLAALNP